MRRLQVSMADRGVDILLLSVGADLPYFTGYEAMQTERLTLLVVRQEGEHPLSCCLLSSRNIGWPCVPMGWNPSGKGLARGRREDADGQDTACKGRTSLGS